MMRALIGLLVGLLALGPVLADPPRPSNAWSKFDYAYVQKGLLLPDCDSLNTARLETGTFCMDYDSGYTLKYWDGDSFENAPAAGTPGGSDTQVQLNDGGSFGADADFIYDDSADNLKLKGLQDVRFAAAYASGSTTGGINEAIAAFGAGVECGTIVLPKGVVTVTETVSFSNREGCRVVGHGMNGADSAGNPGTTLLWGGAADGTVMEVLHTEWAAFQDFAIECNDAGIGLDIDADNTISPTQQISFTNVHIEDCKGTPGVAVDIGNNTNDQVSEITFNKLIAVQNDIVARVDGSQTQNIVFKDSNWGTYTDYGLQLLNGRVSIEGGAFLSSATSIATYFIANDADAFDFSAFGDYHELRSGNVLLAEAGSSRTSATNFIGTRVNMQYDGGATPCAQNAGRVIDYQQDGDLTIIGATFNNSTAGNDGCVYVDSAPSGGTTTFTSLGNAFQGAQTWALGANNVQMIGTEMRAATLAASGALVLENMQLQMRAGSLDFQQSNGTSVVRGVASDGKLIWYNSNNTPRWWWDSATQWRFEGTTNDDYELTWIFPDPNSDITHTFPDASGTVLLGEAGVDAVVDTLVEEIGGGSTNREDRPCWDLGGGQDDTPDGFCDLWWDDQVGIVRKDGSPYFSAPVAIFSTWADVHEQYLDTDSDGTLEESDGDDAWHVLECAKYGIPCGFNLMDRDDDATFGWGDEAGLALEKGMSIGAHTQSHCAIAIPNSDFDAGFDTATGYGSYRGAGTVSVTEGGTGVTGSGTSFAPTCLGTEFSPVGSSIAVDTDGDGTVEWTGDDYVGYLAAYNSATSLTLGDALAADQDGDGTSSETLSARAFEVVSGPRQWRRELKGVCDLLETALAAYDWECSWFGAPGAWTEHDGYEIMFAASDLDPAWSGTSYSLTPQSLHAGAPMSGYFDRMMVNCETTADAMTALLEQAAADRRSIAFSGHIAYDSSSDPTCTGAASSNDAWSRANLTAALTKMRALMREGRAVVAPPDIAVKLARMWQSNPANGVNLIANSDFSFQNFGVELDSGNVGPRWPWTDVDGDVSIDSTAELSYDATNNWLTINASGTSNEIEQDVRVAAGYYKVSAFVRAESMATGGANGFRLCIRPLPDVSNNGTRYLIDPTWLDIPSATTSIGSNCSAFVTGSKEVQQIGFFEVPPEMDGAMFRVELTWTGTGTLRVRDVAFTRYQPQPVNAKFGGFNVASRNWYNGFPANEGIATGSDPYAAWHFQWAPHGDGQDDQPHMDALGITLTGATARKQVFGIGRDRYGATDTWYSAFGPTVWTGWSDSTTASQGSFMIGRYRSNTGKWVSLAMYGTSDAGAIFLANNDGSTTPTFKWRQWAVASPDDTKTLMDWAVGNNASVTNAGTSVMKLQSSGRLTLAMAATLTPTDSPVTCAAGTKGTLYFDDSMTELCVCDGTNYVQVDGGGNCT